MVGLVLLLVHASACGAGTSVESVGGEPPPDASPGGSPVPFAEPCHESLRETVSSLEGGFAASEVYVQQQESCSEGLCIVNQYGGDLILDPAQGDGIAECVE